MKLTKKSFNNFIIFLFLFVCIFFPGDPYGVKTILLAFLYFLNIKTIINKMFSPKYIIVLIIGIFYPCLVILHSTILTHDFKSAISGAYSIAIFVLLIPIIENDLKYKEYVINILFMLSIVTIIIAIGDIIGLFNINNNSFIRNMFYEYGMGVIGKSATYSSYYRIFFSASPLLVVLLSDSIKNNNWKRIIISFLALWFSGTRANVFSALIILVFGVLIWNDNDNFSLKYRLIIAFICFLLLIIESNKLVVFISGLMNTAGAIGSDEIRSGALMSYIELFKDPFRLIFGYGFGTYFYNYGRGNWAITSELSYLELIRCIGLLYSIVFFVFAFYPVFSKKIKRDLKTSYICYLIIAATNPLLFSSTAIIIYSYYYIDYIKNKSIEGKKQEQNMDNIDETVKALL